MAEFMTGAGAGLHHQPDLVLVNYDGAGMHLLVDVKTMDKAGTTHVNTDHTDERRLSSHAAEVRHCERDDYRIAPVQGQGRGPLPRGMRLVVFAVSTFGSFNGRP